MNTLQLVTHTLLILFKSTEGIYCCISSLIPSAVVDVVVICTHLLSLATSLWCILVHGRCVKLGGVRGLWTFAGTLFQYQCGVQGQLLDGWGTAQDET